MSLRHLLSLLALVLGLFVSRSARAETYTIIWDSTILRSLGSCGLVETSEDAPYFVVNGSPRMTYMDRASHRKFENGDEYVRYSAEFDSSLLAAGDNTFVFQVNLGEMGSCKAWDAMVWLLAPRGFPGLLFSVSARGTQVLGETTRVFKLAEIRPQIAADYSALIDAINAGSADLLAQAGLLNDLAASLDALANIKRGVEELLKNDISRVTSAQLDALLSRYPILPADVRAALVRLLEDYKKEVAALERDVAKLTGEFAAAAGILPTMVPHGLGEPSDPTGYAAPAIDVATFGPVAVPDIVPDPLEVETYPAYDALATATLAQLDSFITAGAVRDRHGFLAAVRSWRANQAAIQRALDKRSGLSRRELRAYLDAQFRVTSRVREFLDPGDWFKDVVNVPQAVRLMVDTLFPEKMPDLAGGLKDTLNEMSGPLTERKQGALDLIETVGHMLEPLEDDDDVFDDYSNAVLREVVAMSQMLASTISGSLPGVGLAVGMCEAVKGWPACNDTAPKLSDEQRIHAGVTTLASVGMWGAATKFQKLVAVGAGSVKRVKQYRAVFFGIHPELQGKVWVHHAVEQQVLTKYPNLFTKAELDLYGNLRGIPKAINNDIHLSKIRVSWNKFYKANPNATRAQVLEHKLSLDKLYGRLFKPPFIVTE